MNNAVERKTSTREMVAGIVTTVAFVIMFISGIAGIVDIIGFLIELSKNEFPSMGSMIVSQIPAILLSLASMLASILLTAYCGLNVILKGKRIRALYVAGFVILMLVFAFSILSNLISLIFNVTNGWVDWYFVVTICFNILMNALASLACLFSIIAGFVKKPKAVKAATAIAVILFVLGAALAFVQGGLVIIHGADFLSVLKNVFGTVPYQIVRLVAYAGTLIFLRPVKKQ